MNATATNPSDLRSLARLTLAYCERRRKQIAELNGRWGTAFVGFFADGDGNRGYFYHQDEHPQAGELAAWIAAHARQ